MSRHFMLRCTVFRWSGYRNSSCLADPPTWTISHKSPMQTLRHVLWGERHYLVSTPKITVSRHTPHTTILASSALSIEGNHYSLPILYVVSSGHSWDVPSNHLLSVGILSEPYPYMVEDATKVKRRCAPHSVP